VEQDRNGSGVDQLFPNCASRVPRWGSTYTSKNTRPLKPSRRGGTCHAAEKWGLRRCGALASPDAVLASRLVARPPVSVQCSEQHARVPVCLPRRIIRDMRLYHFSDRLSPNCSGVRASHSSGEDFPRNSKWARVDRVRWTPARDPFCPRPGFQKRFDH
jgi:hypothetical protein